jgi:hypothetical protein
MGGMSFEQLLWEAIQKKSRLVTDPLFLGVASLTVAFHLAMRAASSALLLD